MKINLSNKYNSEIGTGILDRNKTYLMNFNKEILNKIDFQLKDLNFKINKEKNKYIIVIKL